MMRARISRFLIFVTASAGFAVAAVWSIRLGWADYWIRQETPAATEKAIAITPGQAIYYARLAFLLSESQPARAVEALQRAVALNPWEARNWIELGLRYEANGDAIQAERYLLRAAEVDTEYLPRWTLANYYFRQNDLNRFWLWAKQAASMAYDDPLPLFRLCGKVEEDGRLIDRLEIHKPEIRADYLSYLLSQNRVDLIVSPSLQVLAANRISDTPLLLSICDRLLEGGRIQEAMDIWNGLAETHRISFGTRQVATPPLLTNETFAVEPISRGFDWRLPGVDGISVARENPAGLRLTFSGSQPEYAELLVQYVPIQENQEYKLRFLYRTSGIASDTGLQWHITDMRDAASLSEGRSLSSEDETEGRLSFTTPVGCRLIRLALEYRRNPGTTRINGFLVLRSVALAT